MPAATISVDPDVYASVGGSFLSTNDDVCDAVAAAADSANQARGMAGVDSTGASWAHDYDIAAGALLRASSTVVDALGVVGDRLVASGANHDAADAASVPGGGPATFSAAAVAGRAVSVVVSAPPSADGTPADPPPGWALVAHLIAYTWPAGHPSQLRAVGAGWLRGSLLLSEQADLLNGPISDLAGQSSPDLPYALAYCTGVQSAMRTVADQYAILADACTTYGNHLDEAHRDVIGELVGLVTDEAVIEVVGAVLAAPTGGMAEIPTQGVAGARISAAALRVGRILWDLAKGVLALQTVVQGIAEHVVSVLVSLQEIAAQRDTIQAVTTLIEHNIPPIDLQANEAVNPDAHVISRHVAKSDGYLIGRRLPIASTFTSLTAATAAISTLIAASGAVIATWLTSSDPEVTISGPLTAGAGRSYLRRSKQFVQSTQLRIVLRRNASGYYIYTAYPEP